MWGIIPKSKLQTPYKENSPVDHPMAGSDVYKVLWGANFETHMSDVECKGLLYKLYKIRRLEEK